MDRLKGACAYALMLGNVAIWVQVAHAVAGVLR